MVGGHERAGARGLSRRRHGARQDGPGHRAPFAPPPESQAARRRSGAPTSVGGGPATQGFDRRSKLGRRAPTPMLVVCPTSLLGNWERELHNSPRRCLSAASTAVTGTWTIWPLTRSCSLPTASFGESARRWGGGLWTVVADEAQHAKNPCPTPPRLCAPSPRRRGSPSPAPRSRTASPSCGRSSTGRPRGCSGRWSASGALLPSPSSATMTRRRPSVCPMPSGHSSCAGKRQTLPSPRTCRSGRSPTWPYLSRPNRCRCTRPRYARPCTPSPRKSRHRAPGPGAATAHGA